MYSVAEDAVRQIDEHISIIATIVIRPLFRTFTRRREMLADFGRAGKRRHPPEQMLTEEINRLRTTKVSR